MSSIQKEIAAKILGSNGSVITNSKSSYRQRHPENLSIFNANVCTKGEKIWYGDLDVTLKQDDLSALAEDLQEDLYILYELDGRFENESSPKINRFAVKFFYDGGLELSESLKSMYGPKLKAKPHSLV